MNRSVLFHVFGALLLAAHASLAFAQSEGERRVRIEITRNENGSESHITREFDLNDQQQLADALRELGVMDELNVIGDDENLVIDLKRMRDGGMLNDMSMALSMADAEAPNEPRAYLGVYYGDWNESCDKAEKKKGPPVKEGACVTAVEDGTPADKAGLKEGDVIVAMDDRKIGSGSGLLDAIQDHKPGDSVKITFYRGTEKKTVSTTLAVKEDGEEAPDYDFNFDWGQNGAAHERAMAEFANAFKAEENGAFLGVDGEDMPDDGGVRITNVVDSSAAELMGLKEGDIITSINDEKIEDFEDLADLMDETDPNSDAQVHVKRDDPDKPGTASELTINGKLGQRKTIAWNWDGDMGGPVVAPMPPMPMMPHLNGSAMSPEDKEQYERDMEQYQTDMEEHARDMEAHDRDGCQ